VVAVKERPILMAAPMVLRTLDGKKGQTRRPIRWRPYSDDTAINLAFSGLEVGNYCTGVPSSGWVLQSRGGGGCWNDRTKREFCPYGDVGDHLYVRETWRAEERESDSVDGVAFAADGAFRPIESTREAADRWVEAYDNGRHGAAWRPSIHMPRWASRLVLEITEVRVQRVQDISAEDAIAEGLTALTKDGGRTVKYGIPDRDGWPGNDDHGWHWHEWEVDPRKAFAKLWDSVNPERVGWAANPWVFAISFRKVGTEASVR
jgi:hypothetical protein